MPSALHKLVQQVNRYGSIEFWIFKVSLGIEYKQTKSKSRIKLQSSWILSKHLIEDNYEPLTQFICQSFDFNTLKSSAKFPMSASYNALFWRLLKFCPCFLDAQASLAPTPVRTSVRKFVGHTFRFPFCQCL